MCPRARPCWPRCDFYDRKKTGGSYGPPVLNFKKCRIQTVRFAPCSALAGQAIEFAGQLDIKRAQTVHVMGGQRHIHRVVDI